jgi:hypothetical protein
VLVQRHIIVRIIVLLHGYIVQRRVRRGWASI